MIQAPGWKPDAIPTPQGWRHPQTNELLKSQSISQAELELEAEGREHGIELDRRKNKETLIEELKEVTEPKAPKPKSRYVKT